MLSNQTAKRDHDIPPPPLPDLTSKIIKSDDESHGVGGFGDVYKRQYQGDDGVQEVAIKVFRFQFTLGEDQREEHFSKMIHRELGLCRRLRHPNIVPFLGIVYNFGMKGNVSLVSLWMPNGTLGDYLKANNGQLTTMRRLELLANIAEGLSYLHSFPIVHGDLKDTNVLLDGNNRARLADFGNSSLLQTTPEAIDLYLQASYARPGTVRWTAPELCTAEDEMPPPTTKIDIYAFGNLALLVLSGKLPWSEIRNDMSIIIKLSRGQTPSRPESSSITDPLWNLIQQCWSQVPERPSAEDIVSSVHGFLRDLGVPPRYYRVLASRDYGGLQGNLRRNFVDLIYETSSCWVNLDPHTSIPVGSYGVIDSATGTLIVEGNVYDTVFQQELDDTGLVLRLADYPPVDDLPDSSLVLQSKGVRRTQEIPANDIPIKENFEFQPGTRGALVIVSAPQMRSIPPDVVLKYLFKVPKLRTKWLVTAITVCEACSFHMSDRDKIFSLEFPETGGGSSSPMADPDSLTPLYTLKRPRLRFFR